MTKLLKRSLSAIALVVVCQPSWAEVYEFNGYTHDSDTNIVVGNGLEWMQWNVTKGIGADRARSMYGGYGWRLATLKEMQELFSSFDFGMSSSERKNWIAGENETIGTVGAEDTEVVDPNDPEAAFITMFGATEWVEKNKGSNRYSLSTSAVFGEDEDGDLSINHAEVHDNVFFVELNKRISAAGIFSDRSAQDVTLSNRGVALVREHKQ